MQFKQTKMNEIEERLSSNNPAYICSVFSKLASLIEKKQSEGDTKNQQAEIQFLESKCINKNSLVALTASKTLLKLVQDGIVDRDKILFDLSSTAALAESYSGLCYIINEILVFNIAQNKGVCYNLWSPQHPLVSVLHQNFESSVEIFRNIEKICVINRRNCFITKLYWPVYYYLFCNPESQLDAPILLKFWNLLLKQNDNEHFNLMFSIVSWMQFNTPGRLLIAIDFLMQSLEVHIIDKNVDIIEALAVLISSMLCDVFKLGLNARSVIRTIQKTLTFFKYSSSSNLILLMISSSLTSCPVNYIADLLILCEMLLKNDDFNELPLRCLQISLFNWIIFRNDLLENEYTKKLIIRIERKIDNINNTTKKQDLTFNHLVKKLKNNQYNLHIIIEFYTLSNYLSAESFLFWIARCSSNLNEVLSENIFIPLCGMILFKSLNESAIKELLQLVILLIKKHNWYSTLLLTTVLYKLSSTKNPDLHFMLLSSLPHLIVCKENVPFIVHTFESLRNSPVSVHAFIMKLYFDMWNLDSKYYINLQNLLTEKLSVTFLDELEINVVRAKILREICMKKPELYGGELVTFLSEILNKCGNKNGSLPSSLALEGISALCKAGIVDIFSTLKELSPRFRTDTRDRVSISFCNLISTLPEHFEESERYVKLSEEVTTLLWEFATRSENKSVKRSAYEGLSCFKIEDICSTMPERYKSYTSEVLPAFNVVNCECWINVLKSSPEDTLDAIGNMLSKLIDTEISEFRSKTYQTSEGGREPDSYNYLSVYSPLRAITNYVKLNVQKMELNAVYLQCLRVLSREYKKPLPPLDWCFLQELIHYEQAKFFCICIASHQVRLSGTARRFMENVVVALTTNERECLDVFRNLRFLCDSIQPAILKPFIKNTLTYFLKLYEDDEHFFNCINLCLKNTLSRDDIHEVNRTAISDVLVDVIKNMDQKSASFECILETAAELSQSYVSKFNLDRTSKWKFMLFLKVRIAKTLYSKENHFGWLGEIFNVEDYTQIEQTVILREVVKVIKKYKRDPSVRMWILELLGQTQALLVDNGATEKRLNFLCTTVVISFIFLTDQEILVLDPLEIIKDINMALSLFPSSVYAAVKTNLWQEYVPQLLEWLYNMSNCKFIVLSYRTAFYQTISTLRHEKAFKRKLNWLKYMDKIMDIVS